MALQAYGVHGIDPGVSTRFNTVLQYGRGFVVAPAPDAANVVTSILVSAYDGSGKDTVLDGGRRVQMAHDAAFVVVPASNRCGDDAALNQVGAVGIAHKARRVHIGGVNSACHLQVLDGGVLDVVEGGDAVTYFVSVWLSPRNVPQKGLPE